MEGPREARPLASAGDELLDALRALAERRALPALDAARRAREALRASGAPPERIGAAEWIAEAAALRDDRAADRARELLAADDAVAALASAAIAARDVVPPRFARYVAMLARNRRATALPFYPGLTSRAWHDASAFPIARELEAKATSIAREFRALDPALFHRESEAIAREGDWDVGLLLERGRRNEPLCERCPETLAVLSAHRVVRGLAGLAYFSRLGPGARVAPHRGPTNLRLRCHLGIAVPEGCGLSVDGIAGGWREGRCVVFDDSFEHAAWNASARERIVLIVDVWHPELSDAEIALLQGMERYALALGANAAGYWAANARERSAARAARSPEMSAPATVPASLAETTASPAKNSTPSTGSASAARAPRPPTAT